MTAAESKTVAVLDACVFYPPSLRDLLMRTAVAGAYAPRWTEQIHDEWTRNVMADNPDVTPAQLDRTRRLMSQAVPEGLVSGYEALVPNLRLPDANDRHVLAAAIKADAAVIVTFNLSDFPAMTLAVHGIQPLHPDVFLSALFDDDPALFLDAIRSHRASLKSPPKTAADYIQTLKATGLKGLALHAEEHFAAI